MSRESEFAADQKKTRDGRLRLACGKYVYPSRQLAKKAVKRVRGRRVHAKPGVLREYRCELCQGWHIGHTTWLDREGRPRRGE